MKSFFTTLGPGSTLFAQSYLSKNRIFMIVRNKDSGYSMLLNSLPLGMARTPSLKSMNGNNRIYDGAEAETRKSQARFQII